MISKTPYTLGQKIDYLLGQNHALLAFAQAVRECHADEVNLQAVFEQRLLQTEAYTLPTLVSDAHLQGLRDVQARLF